MNRTYTTLLSFSTFEDRFRYLALNGRVGEDTFGHLRDLNQRFYGSYDWHQMRQYVIARDEARDLAIPGREIFGNIYIHHLNPMTPDALIHGDPSILDPENLISVSHTTHNAIHYGDERQLPRQFVDRTPGDTKLW